MPLCLSETVIENRISKSIAIHFLTIYVLAATLYFVYATLLNLRGFW